MAERLRFKAEEIDKVIEKITALVINCTNISKFSITAKDIIDNEKDSIKNIIKPTLKIPAAIYNKMFQLVEQSPIEISWHGLVHRDLETHTYIIYDILLFPQINSPTTTTTDEDKFAEWTTKLIMDKDFPIQDLRMHGHSHVNMQVFSSGVDDAYQNDLLAKVQEGDYYLFLILNKRHEICALLYDYSQQILFTTKDITIQIIDNNGNDINEWAKEQIKEYCEEKPKYNYNKYANTRYYNLDEDDVTNYYPYIKGSNVAPKKNFKENKYGSK